MRYNGLQLVIRLAVQKLRAPELQRFEDALILGAIREDICYLARKQTIREHWSLTHFTGRYLDGGFFPWITTGAPAQAQRYFNAGLDYWQQQDQCKAFMQLGRASHLLIDMACPVHVHRVPHFTDGYEWLIEANYARFRNIAFDIPAGYATPFDIVRGLARYTQQFPPDRTNHHWGRILKSLRLRCAIDKRTLTQQADCIIPVAAGHLAALYQQFLFMTRQRECLPHNQSTG